VFQEFDLGEVGVDLVTFVPRGANRKKYFIVKEDRELKEDILKAILETEEVEAAVGQTGTEGKVALSKESIVRMDPETQTIVKQLLEENIAVDQQTGKEVTA
jgi:hypothetical protein